MAATFTTIVASVSIHVYFGALMLQTSCPYCTTKFHKNDVDTMLNHILKLHTSQVHVGKKYCIIRAFSFYPQNWCFKMLLILFAEKHQC